MTKNPILNVTGRVKISRWPPKFGMTDEGKTTDFDFMKKDTFRSTFYNLFHIFMYNIEKDMISSIKI